MSMISEQVKELELFARKSKELGRRIDEKIFREAARTIKELSAKLAAANMERSERYYNGADLIDRKCLIDRLQKCMDVSDNSNFTNGLLSAIDITNQQKSECSGWILCEDRLPEEGQKVLATHEGGLNPERQVIEHVFKNGEFLGNWDMDMNFKSPTFGQRYMGKVIAWVPKPQPYKPDKE